MYYPTLEEIKKLDRKDGNLVPVYREIVADLETPVSAFLKIREGGYSFLLESVEGGQRLARYSFIGIDPYQIISTSKNDNTDPLAMISKELSKYRVIPIGDLPRFCGGAVGYLSYDVVNRFEELPSLDFDPLALPESLFMFVDTMLIFDHVTHKIKVISYVHLDGEIDAEYRKALNKIDNLINKLNQQLNPTSDKKQPSTCKSGQKVVSNFTREEFETSIQKIKEYITAGEVIQVVLSHRLSQTCTIPPFEIYRTLRTLNPSPYMFFFDCVDFCIIGASPEILVRVEDGIIMTRPLAGTRPRGKNPEEDLALEQELRHDEKECAEHIMLVDLGRNDVGRVSTPGTVTVSDLMNVERYSHIMHLVTHVQGKLREGCTNFDALRACFPAGTVSGAPKIRAMEIIAELEHERRGPYAGAVGYFSFSGNMDMAIAIRTMIVKDDTAHVQTGCGVVYDSVPEREYEETLNKAQALLKAIDQTEHFHKSKGGVHAAAH